MEDNNEWTKLEIIQKINSIKKYVKESNIPGQNHLDISLVDANERDEFYKTISIAKKAVQDTIITENEFKDLLGLK